MFHVGKRILYAAYCRVYKLDERNTDRQAVVNTVNQVGTALQEININNFNLHKT